MNPQEAFDWLAGEGYITVRMDGWFYFRSGPRKEDLHRFVKAVKVLGAWSVETANGKPRVRITTGGADSIDAIMFKLDRI
jgi:hypothetical protein